MRIKPRRGSWILVFLFMIAWVSPITARATGSSTPIPNAGFEDGTLTNREKITQILIDYMQTPGTTDFSSIIACFTAIRSLMQFACSISIGSEYSSIL